MKILLGIIFVVLTIIIYITIGAGVFLVFVKRIKNSRACVEFEG